jgi:plastocyanin
MALLVACAPNSRASWCVPAALVLLTLTGCGKQAGEPTGTVLVAMADNSYSPSVVRVPVDSSIVFINTGRNIHNAIAVDKSWSSETTFGNIQMPSGTMTEIVFHERGAFPYYCSFHASPDGKVGMTGVVLVGDVEYSPGQASERGLKAVADFSGTTRRVPQEYPTIQNAVDAATPGDLVLVDKGVYVETVFVTTPSVTIRGVDRNDVVLDGRFTFGNGIMVGADAVAIENMTARNYTLNGFFWTGVKGFRASYLTAYNNGDYGLYAFDATDGVFEHSYASGSPDAAFYVGQCFPCRVVLDHVTGELSGLGYSGTNSGGDMYILNSTFSRNKSGIATTTFDIELLPPGRQTVIMGNVVTDNDARSLATSFYATESLAGQGIVLAGTIDNRVERNYVHGNSGHGIVLLPLNDRNYWPATGNVVRDNVVLDSGRADIAAAGLGTIGNCFEGNRFGSSLPWGLQALNGCSGLRLPLASDLSGYMGFLAGIASVRSADFTPVDYKDREQPLAQPNMPGGADAEVVPAIHPFDDFTLDLSSIRTPGPAVPGVRSAQAGDH